VVLLYWDEYELPVEEYGVVYDGLEDQESEDAGEL
jgi:hypothetical protein